MKTGTVPDLWKANITPVFKNSDPSDPSDDRPVSPLSTVGKVMEKIVHKNVFNFVPDCVLTALQSFFVPGDFSINQSIYL